MQHLNNELFNSIQLLRPIHCPQFCSNYTNTMACTWSRLRIKDRKQFHTHLRNHTPLFNNITFHYRLIQWWTNKWTKCVNYVPVVNTKVVWSLNEFTKVAFHQTVMLTTHNKKQRSRSDETTDIVKLVSSKFMHCPWNVWRDGIASPRLVVPLWSDVRWLSRGKILA